MSKPTLMDKSSEAPSDELSSQTVLLPRQTLLTEPVAQMTQEEDEEDDMPILIFDWIDDNANVFLQRWEMRNVQVLNLNPTFNRPANSQQLYALLLEEFVRDIEGAKVVCKTCIQCDSSAAYGYVAIRMDRFESRPWVSTVIGGQLPGTAKLANLFLTTTVHKCKPLELECRLF